MTSRKQIQVEKLKLTPEQMQAAIKRASENVKTLAIWTDPKAPAENSQDNK